jgi:hypothetical protein
MFSTNPQDTTLAACIVAAQIVCDAQQLTVSTVALAHTLTDDERERHIASTGYLMLAAYQRYEESHCLGDLGEAHRWRGLMEDAIKGRSAAQVARLESARGLA